MDRRQRLGKEGEKLALDYLLGLGVRVLATNYRCRIGEIDIVLLDEGEVVFLEVRTKSTDSYGSGAESITLQKSSKLRLVAQHYLACHNLFEASIRFDVISIYKPALGVPRLEHIRAAF